MEPHSYMEPSGCSIGGSWDLVSKVGIEVVVATVTFLCN